MRYEDIQIGRSYILLKEITEVGLPVDWAGRLIKVEGKKIEYSEKIWFRQLHRGGLIRVYCYPEHLQDGPRGQVRYTQLSFDFSEVIKLP